MTGGRGGPGAAASVGSQLEDAKDKRGVRGLNLVNAELDLRTDAVKLLAWSCDEKYTWAAAEFAPGVETKRAMP
eukprot:313790-Alexandrium_andersonii.AAC.1